jgi:hypothetical protein
MTSWRLPVHWEAVTVVAGVLRNGRRMASSSLSTDEESVYKRFRSDDERDQHGARTTALDGARRCGVGPNDRFADRTAGLTAITAQSRDRPPGYR